MRQGPFGLRRRKAKTGLIAGELLGEQPSPTTAGDDSGQPVLPGLSDAPNEAAHPSPPHGLRSAQGLQALLELRGIGSVRALRIASAFTSREELLDADPEQVAGVVGVRKRLALHDLRDFAREEPDPHLVGFYDKRYPRLLRTLSDPPPLLYVRGTLPDRPCVAIVGTRRPTSFGETIVRTWIHDLSGFDVGIVSGLALGIDTLAHLGALENGLPTWAVLGSGVDVPSPASNRVLAERIIDAGGGLIAEVPYGTTPSSSTLLARNRIQAALSVATMVAQCGAPSGTLTTALRAVECGSLLVVPRPAEDEAKLPANVGNALLTSEDGVDPGMLGAKGREAEPLRSRKPFADVVLESPYGVRQQLGGMLQ